MMKRLFAAGAVMALFVSGAGAADLDERTNRLDPAPRYGNPTDELATPSFNPTGFYINGELGWAWMNRDFDRSFSVNGKTVPTQNWPISIDNGGSALGPVSNSQDIESLVYGGGFSYLYKPNSMNLGFEIGTNVSFYDDAGSDHNIVDLDWRGFGNPDILEITAGRTFDFERDHDIDILFMGHYFFNERMSLRFGAGPSWASASAHMGYSVEDFDGEGVSQGSAFIQSNPEDNALGIVAKADLNYWPQDMFRITLGYEFKRHEFEFEHNGGCTFCGKIETASDKATVQDDIHAIKASVGIKF